MKKCAGFKFSFCVFLALLMCGFLVMSFSSYASPAVSDMVHYRAPYMFSIDSITGGAHFSGSSLIHIYENYVFPESGVMNLKGWIATDEGISHYEYAWISEGNNTPLWIKASNIVITARHDLASAGIPYSSGHSTAGFSVDVLPPDGISDGYYDLYIRAVTGDGIPCDLALFSHMMYGTPDYDDGEKHIISFDRIAKTEGALTMALFEDSKLIMTNQSVVALGNLHLGAFDHIKVTYTVSQSYTDGKKALIGFKSAPEHLYGDGIGQYDLTDHVTCLPLDTSKTEPQTAELDLNKTQLSAHESLYLSTYIKDGVTLTVHEIELTYRGKGYDTTAAKIYFSEDLIGSFAGRNQVDLKGVQDPVMGDVLRIELIDDTNDPYTHFNASGVLNQYDLRLTADDYKYMVVLARANKDNLHSNMTFYLCAGTIYGATEACTYTHQLIKDGQWHYYVFDLTATENWKGNINGWRFDIINGESLAGNYVDFASIQFFRTPEAAAAAAKASVTQNVTPHTLGMSAVVPDDIEDVIVSDSSMIFEDGDWFVETTQPETEIFEDTLTEDPLITTSPEETVTEEITEHIPSQASGCASTVFISSFLLMIPFNFMIKKKKSEDI